MAPTPWHLKALKEIERECLPGLVKVLNEEGLEAVRNVLWDVAGWEKSPSTHLWKGRASEQEQKRARWEVAVRIERILAGVLHEAYKAQIEQTIEALSEGPENLLSP